MPSFLEGFAGDRACHPVTQGANQRPSANRAGPVRCWSCLQVTQGANKAVLRRWLGRSIVATAVGCKIGEASDATATEATATEATATEATATEATAAARPGPRRHPCRDGTQAAAAKIAAP